MVSGSRDRNIGSKNEDTIKVVGNKKQLYLEIVKGPKLIFISYPAIFNKSIDSIELDLEYLSSNYNLNISKEEIESEYKTETELPSKNIENKVNSNHNFDKVPVNTPEYSMKFIDNNAYPAQLIFTERRNLNTEQMNVNNSNSLNNNINTTNTIIEKVNFCICSSNGKSKKRLKNKESSFFSSLNHNLTKRSTNLSLKSLKLNDSLNKLRRRKSIEINSNILEGNKRKINCACLIF